MNRLLSVALAIGASLAAAWPAGAGAAEDRQTYGEAMRWYSERAAAGDPKAQFYHGLALEKGAQGRRGPDLDAAIGWFEKAAGAGFALAQFKLALIRQFGADGRADPAEARRLYALAAEQGVAEARYNLAVMLRDGEGGPPDAQGAARRFEEAARGGVAVAFLHLASLYANGGEGLDPDPVEAMKWAILANHGGLEAAGAFRKALRAGLTGERAAEAEARAEAWE